MNLLEELTRLLSLSDIPVETGEFSGVAPDQYFVLVPLADTFEVHADNLPGVDVQEVRISLYAKGSYTALKNALVRALLENGFTITERTYIGYETDTGYHHYNVDVAQYYELEET